MDPAQIAPTGEVWLGSTFVLGINLFSLQYVYGYKTINIKYLIFSNGIEQDLIIINQLSNKNEDFIYRGLLWTP